MVPGAVQPVECGLKNIDRFKRVCALSAVVPWAGPTIAMASGS